MAYKVSLQPDPRILPMLGEINLSQERCIAELVDNSIDGFLMESRLNDLNYLPQVSVDLPPTQDDPKTARIVVRDNGPGMSPEVLAKAVKAGWTGNDPVGNLGLFGMGFNIATARLGRITQVWTTKSGEKEWKGLEIDFQKLVSEKSFETDLLIKSKTDPDTSGTEIVITKLKPEQAAWFRKQTNRSKLKTFFSKVYSTMLRAKGYPIHYRLLLCGKTVKPKQHCVWGDHGINRSVQTKKYGQIDALQVINHTLPSKSFCMNCWAWLPPNSTSCHACGEKNQIIDRQRKITGWLGILRYLSQTDYGIDFIRNGRKIEIQDRSLFRWERDGVIEDEYPIDDPRRRGRIVGEIHLDHCRVSYTKNRFDRDDAAWNEMIKFIRGEGPLRPDKAVQLGYTQNVSPLFLLFQAFRRSTPTSKVAGAYENLLVVKNNALANDFANKFCQGDPKYQNDSEWFKLVQEADNELLISGGSTKKRPTKKSAIPEKDNELSGIISPSPAHNRTDGHESIETESYNQEIIASLSRDFVDDISAMRFQVEAFDVESDHPKFNGVYQPWFLERKPNGTYTFFVEKVNDVFKDGFTILDALLSEISHTIVLLSRDQNIPPLFSTVLCSMRNKYIEDDALDADLLAQEASHELLRVSNFLADKFCKEDNLTFFNELNPIEQSTIISSMATSGIQDSQYIISRGLFLDFATPYTILGFVERHPEVFFDGNLWDAKYDGISYEDIDAKQMAQESILRQFTSLLNDIIWLSKQSSNTITEDKSGLLIRSKIALDTLRSYRDEQ